MNQIHVDPEKLREFSRELKDFSTHVDTSLRNLNGQMADCMVPGAIRNSIDSHST